MENIFNKLHRFFKDGFHLAVLNMEAGARWIVEPKPRNIAYLKAENAQGRHILIKPQSQESYLMADDLSPNVLRLHHKFNDGSWKPGRMVVETSAQNYQVWIHAHRPIPLLEKRHWLKKLKSDPGADPSNRWGRCPGFRNRKKKHYEASKGYPLAKLVWIDWKQKAHIPEPDIPAPLCNKSPFSHQPLEGGVCQNISISRQHYERGDESATDFAYALALMRRGAGDSSVRGRLLLERSHWKNHAGSRRREAYFARTIEKARRLVESTPT